MKRSRHASLKHLNSFSVEAFAEQLFVLESEQDLQKLAASIFKKVPVSDDHAELIAELLVDTELRGVVSHGVKQVKRYVRSCREGKTNPRPRVRTIKEGPAALRMGAERR